MIYTYTWAGREWATHPAVPDPLLRRLVRASSETPPNPRQFGKRSREVLLAATVEREELAKALPLASLPGDLMDRVMPELLEHYAKTTAQAANRYADKRRGKQG